MQIDEFKATLRQLAYTTTNVRSGMIKVYSHKYWQEDNVNGWCFRLAPARKTVIVEKQWDKLDGMPVFCVRDLLNLIAELDKTPVKERFPEKKYVLSAMDVLRDQYLLSNMLMQLKQALIMLSSILDLLMKKLMPWYLRKRN